MSRAHAVYLRALRAFNDHADECPRWDYDGSPCHQCQYTERELARARRRYKREKEVKTAA